MESSLYGHNRSRPSARNSGLIDGLRLSAYPFELAMVAVLDRLRNGAVNCAPTVFESWEHSPFEYSSVEVTSRARHRAVARPEPVAVGVLGGQGGGPFPLGAAHIGVHGPHPIEYARRVRGLDDDVEARLAVLPAASSASTSGTEGQLSVGLLQATSVVPARGRQQPCCIRIFGRSLIGQRFSGLLHGLLNERGALRRTIHSWPRQGCLPAAGVWHRV